MIDYNNAAPQVNDLGARDLSRRTIPVAELQYPQHIPKFYGYFATGPMGPQYLDLMNETVTEKYGDASFDVKKPYYTHQTPFLQAAVRAGNSCVVHRLPGEGMTDVANKAFYLDVLAGPQPVYEKNEDGSLKFDTSGNPVPVLDSSDQPITVNGYSVALITDHTEVPLGEYQPGVLTQRPGIQVSGQTQSVQYPLFELAGEYAGEDALRLAARFYPALSTDVVPFPENFMAEAQLYPYYFQLMKASSAVAGKVDPVYNGTGGQYVRFTLTKDARDPGSDAVIDLKTVLTEQYIEPDSGYASGLGHAHVYDDNVALLSQMFYEAEMVVADPHRDSQINNSETNYGALNLLTFTSSNGSPYQAIKQVDVTGSVRLTRYSNHFLQGAKDGEMSEALMDTQVADDMLNYENIMSEYHDLVLHPESHVYDSGFNLDAKRALCKFISKRKDTFVVHATHAHNAPAATVDLQVSVGIAVKTMIELYPESAYWGTPVARGLVMGGSGELANSLYKKRVSTSYELLCMASAYMGASNGKWKNGYCFDKAPNNVLKYLKNLDVTWVPVPVRSTMWKVGVNFALNYKVKHQFFPALQTVYEDDTSILNSFFAATAIGFCAKVNAAAWREFSGDIEFTPAQFEERMDTWIAEQLKDRFDGKLIALPETKVTEKDELRGYSWTSNIRLYGNVSKTVSTAYTTAYRMSDLAT